MKRAYKTFESWYHNLFVAEIVTRSYNFHRWTSKPTEIYSVNSKRTCKPLELHTIMKKCNGTGLVLKICETKNNVWKKHELSILNGIDNYIEITKIKLDSAIKRFDSFEFTNPGILKLPLEDIYRGGNSKSRNPHMQTMLRLVGFGDNAGSGFPTILDVWKSEGWIKPELIEDTNLDQVTLVMKMEKESDDNSAEKSAESAEKSADSKK